MSLSFGLGSTLAKPARARSFRERVAISGLLSGGEQVVILVLRLATTLVATRLLAPDIFGLFALVLTFQTVLTMITDFGIRPLILTAEDRPTASFLRTCWTVQALRGALLWVFLALVAGAIWLAQQTGWIAGSSSYAAVDLPLALAASAFVLVFQGLESVNLHMASRDLDLSRITVINLVHAALAAGLTIGIAWIWPSIWALVLAGVVAGFCRLVLTHAVFEGPVMRPAWCGPTRQVIRTRGKWIMGHSALTVLVNEGDRILLGAVLPAPLFGMYYLAKQIAQIPYQMIIKVHASIALQVCTVLAEQGRDAFRSKFYRYRLPLDALACTFAGGFLTAGPAVIAIVYDPRYAEAGRMLQWLALALPLLGPGLLREAFLAERAFRFATLVNLLQAMSLWLLMSVAIFWFDNLELALLAVAMHRIPEIGLVLFRGRQRGWVDLLRECTGLPFLALGALCGLALVEGFALLGI